MIKDDRGVILLVTLWLLAILSLLAIGIGFRTSIQLKLVSYQIDNLKAYELAKAGIIKAINELEKDEKKETDTIWECGITLKENETFNEKFQNVRLGEGHFDISYIEDLQGKININSAPRNVLMGLVAAVANAGEVADNIRAWRGDAGEGAPPSEAKDYSDKPYSCKEAPFDAVSELLLVKGITQEIYYGKDEETGLKGLVTVFGPKDQKGFKININTADQKTLETVLDAYNLATAAAANIVAYRSGEDRDINTISDNKAFTSTTELQDFLKTAEGGDVDNTTLNNFSNNISILNSNYFRIRSVGTLEGRKSNIHRTITCVVKREISDTPPHKTEILSWVEE